jgi:HEAT repeat protein
MNTTTTFLLLTLALQTEAASVVEQMRGLSMQLQGIAPGNGVWSEEELYKRAILKRLHELDKQSLPPLIRALKDSDVQMRRNAALALLDLAGGFSPELRPVLDIRAALPELIEAMQDSDPSVRGWAAQAAGEIGPNAKDAIHALVRLLSDPDEGPRNSGCIALGNIGRAAREALPALRQALTDPSIDVRRFAQRAIEKIAP